MRGWLSKLLFSIISFTVWIFFVCAALAYFEKLNWQMVAVAVVAFLCNKILKESNFVKIVQAIAEAFKK